MSDSTKNFHAHGGNEWIIGGKLTFLPGAVVEGAEGLFDLPGSGAPALPYVPDSEATTVAGLREDYNRLLSAMKAAGVMTPDPADEPGQSSSP